MAPKIPIESQSYDLHPDTTKTIAPEKKLGSPLKNQQTLKKEDLAPDWVWEYGIMG